MAKSSPTQDNVVIIDPDTEEVTKENDMETKIAATPKGEVRKGHKACFNCGEIIAARSMHCSHCGYDYPPKDPLAPKAARTPRAPRATVAPAPKIDKFAIYKVIKARGYDLSVVQDVLDADSTPTIKCEAKIQPLVDLLEGAEILSTTPAIKIAFGLDEVLKMLKIPERK